jgi:hypothetical protein
MGILTNLTPAKISQLSVTRILALTASDIAEMTAAQAGGLTASQLIFFSAGQLGALTKSQISALSVPALSGLMPAQIALLKPAQVSGFTPAQTASLNVIQIAALSPASIAGLSPAQIAALSPTQLGALKTSQISGLTPAQIDSLSLGQLGALSAAHIAALSPTQAAALTPAQIAALKPAQFASLTAADLDAFSTSQIKALTVSQLAALTPAQLAGLSAADIGALSATQIASLNVKDISALTDAQLKGLTAPQVAALTSVQLKALSAAQIKALTPAAVAGFTAPQLAALTPAQRSGLSPAPPSVQPVTPAVTPVVAPAVTPAAPPAAPVSPPAPPEVQTPSAQQLAAMSPAQLAALSASQINALNSAQLASLKINYNTMLGILQADAAGGITDAEFGALKALVGKFNTSGGIAVSDYLEEITENLVLGDAANATWTGGASYTMPLGNLTASASQAQANQLIGKWFLGTDLPGSRVSMNGVPNFTVTHTAVSKPLFGGNGPSMQDINQGYLGDCFMLAPLAAMALQDPSSVRSMITDNGNNTWGIRFIVDGKAEYVTVNNELAEGGGKFASGTNKWVGLVEKGYAQLQAGGNTTGNDFSYGNSYSSIANGGSPAVALAELTGAGTISQYVATASGWSSYEFDGVSLTQRNNHGRGTVLSSKTGLSSAAVQAKLVADLAEGDEVILSSYATEVDATGKTTLVANHAMTVSGFDAATGMFEIYNPWGTSSSGSQNWDESFEVSLADLLADGDVISVANSTAPKPIAGNPAPLLPSMSQPFGGSSLGLTAAFG